MIRQHLLCVYQDDAHSLSTIEEFRQLRRRLKQFEALLIPGAGGTAISVSSSSDSGAQSPRSLSERLEQVTGGPLTVVGYEVYRLHQTHPAQVNKVCHMYFQTVHLWMPIVSPTLFYARMADFCHTKSPDFSLLFLSMLLFMSYPQSGTSCEPLYRNVQSVFWQISASMDDSIELIQAGILIACYEYASGLVAASYKTIGQCTRMGYWMGLHLQHLPTQEEDECTRLKGSERFNMWWAVIIRDRYTARIKLRINEEHWTRRTNKSKDVSRSKMSFVKSPWR